MYCRNCGAEVRGGVCPECGTVHNTDNERDYEYRRARREKPLSIVCLITGILSFLGYGGFVTALISIITGAIFKIRVGKANGMATAGVIFAVLSILKAVVSIVISVVVFVVVIVFEIVVMVLPYVL